MSKEIEATRKLFKKSERLQKLMKRVQNQKPMKNNPTAKQIIEQLDKIRVELLKVEDFAIEKSVHDVKQLFLKYAQQTPITDEQIESYARVICTVTFKNGSKVSPPKEIARCIKMGKLIRDLQPKTDDWVSVDERLLKLLVWYQGKSENYRRVTLLVNVLKDFNSLPPNPKNRKS